MSFSGQIPRKLTADEADALIARFNLADAHTHQTPTESEEVRIFNGLAEMFRLARGHRGPDLDFAAFAAYMEASGQSTATQIGWFLPTYASSISMEIFANAVREKRRRILLPTPTFDNIPDILRRNGLDLIPIRLSESADYGEMVLQAIDRAGAPEVALFLVLPNNPTGHIISESAFGSICEACKRTGTLLVLDTSFRSFDERVSYDSYRALRACGADYIVLEDTGKLWPTLDVKVSFIVASPSWRDALSLVYQDFLLNVSPFASALVKAYSDFSASCQFKTVRELIATNRDYLRRALSDAAAASMVFHDSRISVELVRLSSSIASSEELRAKLLNQGVAVLSGRAFYWDRPLDGDRYIRIALARDAEYFRQGVDKMIDIVRRRGRSQANGS